MSAPIAGVVPAEVKETTVMTVWPSVASFGLGRALGQGFAITWPDIYIFRLGNLLALLSIPIALPLFFLRVLPGIGTRYRLTNRRIVVERGVMGTEDKAVDLDRFDAIDYLRADAKYTVIAWRGEDRQPSEAVIRTPLKELVAQLDPQRFAQVHRAVVVNLGAIDRVERADNETARIHLRGRTDVLPVSRSYLHLFRQM